MAAAVDDEDFVMGVEGAGDGGVQMGFADVAGFVGHALEGVGVVHVVGCVVVGGDVGECFACGGVFGVPCFEFFEGGALVLWDGVEVGVVV